MSSGSCLEGLRQGILQIGAGILGIDLVKLSPEEFGTIPNRKPVIHRASTGGIDVHERCLAVLISCREKAVCACIRNNVTGHTTHGIDCRGALVFHRIVANCHIELPMNCLDSIDGSGNASDTRLCSEQVIHFVAFHTASLVDRPSVRSNHNTVYRLYPDSCSHTRDGGCRPLSELGPERVIYPRCPLIRHMSWTSFEVIPAVDLQDGKVVQLVGGERGTGQQYGDPVEAAKRWVDGGAKTLHIVDLDGAFEGAQANRTAIEAIREHVDCTLQVGGGIRSAEAATRWLDSGIDRVILGTAAIKQPALVSELAGSYPDRVIVSLDAKNNEVVIEGWTEGSGLDPAGAAMRYAERGAGAILFTDVDVEGRLEGVHRETIARVTEAVNIPVIASGGVSGIDDLRTLEDAGAAAAVVGTALYEERFTLAEAMQAFDG